MRMAWDDSPDHVRRFAAICIVIETVILAGLVSGFAPGLRNLAIVLGGFWPGLLVGNEPIYPAQGLVMFASSAVLHGGALHLLMNMIGLSVLGPLIVSRLGARGFWPLAGLSAIGAGLAFVLLSDGQLPMVGASGVLFGFLGAVAAWAVLDALDRSESLWPLAQQGLAFFGLNLALVLFAPGSIAWEAHLGGAIAGALAGIITWRRVGAARYSA